MRKPYENKSQYDPGRFRSLITFFQQSTVLTEYGGSKASLEPILTTYAVQEKLSDRNQFAIEAGASILNQDCWYVIRYRKDFTPQKDMIFICGGVTYVIRGIIPVDVPQKYWRLLCVRTELPANVLPPDYTPYYPYNGILINIPDGSPLVYTLNPTELAQVNTLNKYPDLVAKTVDTSEAWSDIQPTYVGTPGLLTSVSVRLHDNGSGYFPATILQFS